MDHAPHLDNTFGAVYISVVVAAILYGVSCIQAFYYFRRYSRKDGWGTKAVVIATLISDTVHQALISHTIYAYLVTDAMQPDKLNVLTQTPLIAVLFSGITTFLVQSFYAVRIWRFSQKNRIIAATLFVVIVAAFIATTFFTAKTVNMTTFVELAAFEPWTITMDGLTAAADTLITVVFCVLLRNSRSPLQRSNVMIDLLITLSIQSGMLTTLCAICALATVVASPHSLIYVFFYFLECRLYCNSLLATLNVRDAILEKGHDNAGISLPPIEDSGLPASETYKGTVFQSDVKSGKYTAGTKAHDGDGCSPFVSSIPHANNPRVSSSLDERDIGDESCYGRRSEHIKNLPGV